jgi:hypothetical protein
MVTLQPRSTAKASTDTPLDPAVLEDLARDALAAPVADPLWLLARQWQTGAFHASDGGSPVTTELAWAGGPLSRNGLPLDGPLEGLVEPEPPPPLPALDAARRIRLASELRHRLAESTLTSTDLSSLWNAWRAAFPAVPAEAEALRAAAARLPDPVPLLQALLPALAPRATTPFPTLPGTAGLAAAAREAVEQAVRGWFGWAASSFSALPGDRAPASWDAARLAYHFDCAAERSDGPVTLTADAYDGSGLDWYSVDKSSLGPTPIVAPRSVRTGSAAVTPTKVSYAGMPRPRWWELEDGDINLDALRASDDPAQAVLAAFAHNYSNDWFLCPLELEPGWAEVTSLRVTDTFGQVSEVPAAAVVDGPGGAWRMWDLAAPPKGDDTPGLRLLWPVGPPALDGPVIEEVVLARDELANLAWMVEQRTASTDGLPVDRFQRWQQQRPEEVNPADRPHATTYRLGTAVPDFWYPLLATGDRATQVLRRASLPPEASGVSDAGVQGVLVPHVAGTALALSTVSRQGRRIIRRTRLVLGPAGVQTWRARVAGPGTGDASSGLRFDILT